VGASLLFDERKVSRIPPCAKSVMRGGHPALRRVEDFSDAPLSKECYAVAVGLLSGKPRVSRMSPCPRRYTES
jgi:hypothetical protein